MAFDEAIMPSLAIVKPLNVETVLIAIVLPYTGVSFWYRD
jgi:hypothetical protein